MSTTPSAWIHFGGCRSKVGGDNLAFSTSITNITLRQGFDKLNLPAQDSAYDTAPGTGTQLGTSGTFSAGWTTVDVTTFITGNGAYNFAFSTTNFSFLLFTGFISAFFLLSHLSNIVHSVLIQPLMSVFGIITLAHFKLLHKANHPNQAQFTGKGSREGANAPQLVVEPQVIRPIRLQLPWYNSKEMDSQLRFGVP